MKRRESIGTRCISSSVRVVIMLTDWVRESGLKATVSLTVILLAAFCTTSVPRVHAWLSGRATLQVAEPEISSSNFTAFNAPGSGSGVLQGTLGISINAAGDIAGSYLDSHYVAHGFVRDANGTIATFDAPGAGTTSSIKGSLASLQGTIPIAINAAGTIVGTYLDAHSCYHGFLRATSGTITEFDVSGAVTTAACTPEAAFRVGTRPIAINSTGTIIGTYSDTNGKYHGFVRAVNGGVTTFDAPPAASIGCFSCGTVPTTIDTAGGIAGYYSDSNGKHYGFVYPANGAITTFSVSNAVASSFAEESDYEGTVGLCMNDSGTVAGTYTDANIVRHGFIRSASGTTISFDIPGAGTGGLGNHIHEGTAGLSIDTAGDVVGIYLDANAAYHGFLRSASGAITTIDAPGAGTNALEGTVAFRINDTGQIAGAYADSSMAIHGFLLALPVAATSTPAFSPAPGTYVSAQTVTISDTTPGASIYYTTNDTTPTPSSNPYTGAITVGNTKTLEAIAIATGYSQSAVATATYTITGGSPVLTLSTNSLTFPIQTLNTASTVQSIKVTNTGTGSATIPTITFGGANPGDFATSADECSGTALAPNASCTIGVIFQPTGTTVRSAVLPVGSSAGSQQTVTLTGTGMYGFHQCDANKYPNDVPVCFDNNTNMTAAQCSAPKVATLTCSWGCALTSLGDILSTFSQSSTPESLDTYLKSAPDKYVPPGSGEMNWCAVPGYLGGAVQWFDGESFATQSDVQSFLAAEILTNHRVVVLELCPADSQHCHYVAVTSQAAGDWTMFDPGWANAYDSITDCQNGKTDNALLTSLNAHLSGITVHGASSGCITYAFLAKVGGALGPAASKNALCVNALSPVELLMTDPSGNQIGSTGQGTDIHSIASASYLREFPILDAQGSNTDLGETTGIKTAYIPFAAGGTYALKANGTSFGPFTLDFHFLASDGSAQVATVSGLAGPGSAAAYKISYSPSPGVLPVITPVASGPSAATSANTIQFGNQPIKTTSSPIVLMLGNTGGAPLQLLGLSVSNGFGQSSNCTSSLASNGTCTISLSFSPSSAGLSTGTLTIASNATKSPLTVTLTGSGIAVTPTVTVTPAPTSITTTQALSVTVAVSGGTGAPTATGSVTLTSGSYTSAATALVSGSATINIPAGSLAAGNDTLTANYPGDSNYNATTGTAPVSVQSFSLSGTAVSVSPGATTGNTSTISVTPLGGFTGSVALTAALTSSPAGAQDPPTLSFGSTTPVSISSAAAGTATLTVSTTAPTRAAVVYPKHPGVPWYATGGAALGCLVLFGIPTRRRSWRTMLGLLVLLSFFAGGVLSCGGGGGGGTGNPGTRAGTYAVTVTGTTNSLTGTTKVAVTVN